MPGFVSAGAGVKSTLWPGIERVSFQDLTAWFFEETRRGVPLCGRSVSRKYEWPCSSTSTQVNFMATSAS